MVSDNYSARTKLRRLFPLATFALGAGYGVIVSWIWWGSTLGWRG